jgi:hypothetical protein
MGLLCEVLNAGGRHMIKGYVGGLCAALVTAMALAVPTAEAQTERNVTTTKRVANAPRSRVTVAPRSFLDAGTEVRQGERKFTDYAFPPGYTSSTGPVTNIGGRIGSARDPFMEPFQLPGFSPW